MSAADLPIEAERLLLSLANAEAEIARHRARLDRRQIEIAEPLSREIKRAPASERAAMAKAAAERLVSLRSTVFRSELAALAGDIVRAERRRAVILQKLEPYGQLGELPSAPGGFRLRGTFHPSDSYARFDVVALDGGSFVARCDNPGPCPSEGWQLFAQRGKPGRDGNHIKTRKDHA